jgi:hypothetical protein
MLIIPLHQVFLLYFFHPSFGITTANKYFLCFGVIFRLAQNSCIAANQAIFEYTSISPFPFTLYETARLNAPVFFKGEVGELELLFHPGQ